jgi:iron complex outermembrane receptor protein
VLDSLDLSFSIRMDDYSDFGDTTNPAAGFNFYPFEWIKIFANWGESFNAPTAVDGLASATIRNYNINAISSVPDPLGVQDPDRTDVLQVVGSTPGTLLPQTAETWNAGFRIEPTFAEGLMISVNYFDIEFDDILGAADPTSEAGVLASPDKFVWNPTQAELDEFLAVVDNADQYPDIDVNDLGLILDRRSANTDQARLDGVDFSVSYNHNTRFGSMYYAVSGTKTLTFELNNGQGWVDNLDEVAPDLAVAGTLGWTRNNMRARVTLNYTNEFDARGELNQTKVDDFLVTDLFFGYDFEGDSVITDGLSVRLNVDNVFDEDPPEWRRNGFALSYNGFTIGRVFKVGVTKTF